MNKIQLILSASSLVLISCADVVDPEVKGGCHSIKSSRITSGPIECEVLTKAECDFDFEAFSTSYGKVFMNSFQTVGEYATCEQSIFIDSLKEKSTKWVGAIQYPEKDDRLGRLYMRFSKSGSVDSDIACGSNPSIDCSNIDRELNEIVFPKPNYADHYILGSILAEQTDGFSRIMLINSSPTTIEGTSKKQFGSLIKIDGPTTPTRVYFSKFGSTPPKLMESVPQEDLDVLDWVIENAKGEDD
jgi:hypothetical protein